MSNIDLLGRRKFIAGLGIAAGAAMVAPAMLNGTKKLKSSLLVLVLRV